MRFFFRQSARAAFLSLTLLAAPFSGGMALAQDYLDVAPEATPPEVNNFKLTEDLLSRMEKVHAALESMELFATEEEGKDATPTINKMVQSIEARPHVMAVLKAHDIAPRDYIVAYFALMSSLAAADAESEEQLVDELKDINPEHIAFGKEYSERIRQLIGE